MKSKFSIDDTETEKAFSLIRTCIWETYLQCFQFKILNDILFTNSRLAKIGLIQSDLCTFCKFSGVETIDHLFEFESYWFAIAKEQISYNYGTAVGIKVFLFSLVIRNK